MKICCRHWKLDMKDADKIYRAGLMEIAVWRDLKKRGWAHLAECQEQNKAKGIR